MSKIHVLSHSLASSLEGVDGMVSGLCFDDKNFYSAVDGGAVRKFPFNNDQLTTTADDVYNTQEGKHITCIDSTRDTSAQNTFFIGTADGKFHIASSNWRIEKTVDAHKGGITCLKICPDGSSIATAGEDGLVKIWGRNGMPRSTLASCGAAVTSLNWDSTAKYVVFTHAGMITVRSASFKQDQNQFRGHRRQITCSAWRPGSNEILTGGEDRIARIHDTDGRMIVEAGPFEFAVSAVGFIGDNCLIGTCNRLFLTDRRLRVLHQIEIEAGGCITVVPGQPRALIAGAGKLALISAIGKQATFRDIEVVQDAPNKLTVHDLHNGVTDQLNLSECVGQFKIAYNQLIVVIGSKINIYKVGNWSTPVIVDTKEPPKAICLSATMLIAVTSNGVQIIGYDGRQINRINDTCVKWELVSDGMVACSPCAVTVINPDGRKHIFAFSVSSGKLLTSEPLSHPTEIKDVQTNQASLVSKSRFAFLNTNGDLHICRFITSNPRQPPSIECQKLANFIDEFQWHTGQDLVATRTSEKVIVWCCPSAIFSTPELMPMLKSEVRLIFDAEHLSSFDQTHLFVTGRDGAENVVQISPFLINVHEYVEQQTKWKSVLQICRSLNEPSLWAVCATLAIQNGEIDAAQEAYAALSIIDRVMFLGKVKKLKSQAAQNAMVAVLQGRVDEAEDILIQGGCLFRAVKMNISLCRWEKALEIARRTKKFIEVVAAFRTKFLKDLNMEETNPEFIKLGPVDLSTVKHIIKQEKAAEIA